MGHRGCRNGEKIVRQDGRRVRMQPVRRLPEYVARVFSAILAAFVRVHNSGQARGEHTSNCRPIRVAVDSVPIDNTKDSRSSVSAPAVT